MIEKGDIVEVINVGPDDHINAKIKVGNRYIVTGAEQMDFGVCIINPHAPAYGWLKYGTYILYKEKIKEKP